ncbi:sirtuin, putative [Acanthamoeba castellanii str. Neff]|uniref:Sirtuin, putative n=1 Tax=Acanthamoeba castellanii (strain ATCC 30010 / Neff) TaxID=1257118 RepID=L8H3J1_ACACF|nr:sirtuin, putative [Acanthamoeba castellanii str. Neff]ELR18991.1 sirtuin, putative [Acanthamoeba castellanii str. Neff]
MMRKATGGTGLSHHLLKPSRTAPTDEREAEEALLHFVASRRNLLVITGAGISTESGLPDYRGPQGSYAKGHKPTLYRDFVTSPSVRQRYWARNMLGWESFSRVQPNPAHLALARMQREGVFQHLNVDRLHQRAGSHGVVELHGHNWAVRYDPSHVDEKGGGWWWLVVAGCGHEEDRAHFQARLLAANPDWLPEAKAAASSPVVAGTPAPVAPSSVPVSAAFFASSSVSAEEAGGIRPDGDANVPFHDHSQFCVPSCTACHVGVVVVVEEAMSHTLSSDGVLVIGSSLMVYSAFRFVRAADATHLPIALLNIGPTRADALSSIHLKLELKAGHVLPQLASSLLSSSAL